MGWSIGFDEHWKRDIGYGVPALCDHPKCTEKIDRGLSYVCGGEPYGGERGCGLYFCDRHLTHHNFRGYEDAVQVCARCRRGKASFKPKPDILEWLRFKMTDSSWRSWRIEQGLEKPRGFYVASRASIPERGEMWRALRSSGVPIISTWIDEDGQGQTLHQCEFWERVENEVKESTALIFYAEPEDFPLKGVLVEVGMAIAAGIPVFAVLPAVSLEERSLRPVGSWLKHPRVAIADSVAEAIAAARQVPA